MANQADMPVVKTEVKQEFGTVWLEDANGVSRKVRVLQVTPNKAMTDGSAGGSGLVRAIVNAAPVRSATATATAIAGGSRPLQHTIVRPSGSVSAQIVRASGSGIQPSAVQSVVQPATQQAQQAGQSAAQSGVSQGSRVSTVRFVPRTVQVVTGGAESAGSASVTAAAAARMESPAVNSPIARLQMEDRQQWGLGTPGRQGARPLVSHRTPTTGTGRLLLPAGGSPATPVSRPTPGTSAGKRPGQSPHLSWSDSKRRRYERNAKGLRHFSMKVCQKVREKGVTTYNEVADELVAELCPAAGAAAAVPGAVPAQLPGAVPGSSPDPQYEQKNVRRRVYDALNVLMAMQIISKERKQIKWLGLPPVTTAVQEPPDCSQEEAACRQRIREKTQQLKDLVLRQIAFKNLVERNRRLEELLGTPEPSSSVQLPFIVVNTDKKTVIDCSMSNDKTEYLFNFDDAFEIHDDIEVLQRMGMALGLENGTITEEDLEKAKSMLPLSLASFVDQVAREGAAANSEAAEAASHADNLLQPGSSEVNLPEDPLQGLLEAAQL